MPKTNQRGFASFLVLILLIIGVFVGVFLANRPTNLKPKAGGGNIYFVDSQGNSITATNSADLAVRVLPPWPAPAASLALKSADSMINAGCSYSTDILVDTGGVKTDGTDAIIKFDPNIFQVSKVLNGKIYADFPGTIVDNKTGRISVSGLSSVDKPFAGFGKLATINFSVSKRAKKDSSAQFVFDFDPNNKTKTTDSNVVVHTAVVDILNSVQNANFTISKKGCGDKTADNQESGGDTTSRPKGSPSPSSKPFVDTYKSLQIALAENPDFDKAMPIKRYDYSSNPQTIKYSLLNPEKSGKRVVFARYETVDGAGNIQSINANPYPADITLTASTAPAYDVTDVGSFGTGGTEVSDLNDQRQVVGSSKITSSISHAFLWENGKMTDLGTLGGCCSRATGINNKGQVVGTAITAAGQGHAFLYDNGVMKDLGVLGKNDSVAEDINDIGQIVGSSTFSNSSIFSHAFLYENDSMKDLGTLGGVGSAALKINNKGQIVGYASLNGSTQHAFLYENDSMKDLGVLAQGSQSYANSINEQGQIVGISFLTPTGGPDSHGFIYENGVMKDLGTLGGKTSSAYDINDHSEIIGSAVDTTNVLQSVIWRDSQATKLLNSLTFQSSINNNGDYTGNSYLIIKK